MRRPLRRFLLTVGLLVPLALSLACGAGSDPGDDVVTEQNYATRSVRWADGCSLPLREVPDATFRAGQTPCLELMLQGYYTEGTLDAELFHGEQHLGTSRIEFNTTQAMIQRLTEGEASSRVTFPIEGQLPPSDAYRLVLRRNDREVATHAFRVVP